MKDVPAADRPTLGWLERWLGEEATPESRRPLPAAERATCGKGG